MEPYSYRDVTVRKLMRLDAQGPVKRLRSETTKSRVSKILSLMAKDEQEILSSHWQNLVISDNYMAWLFKGNIIGYIALKWGKSFSFILNHIL